MPDVLCMSDSDLLAAATSSALRRYPAETARWNYENGLMLYSLLRNSGEVQNHVLDAEVARRLDGTLDEDGAIKNYRIEDFNLDQINMGKVALTLWENTGDRRYGNAVGLLVRQLALQPRTPSGSFWHKKMYPDQVWLDGLYMFGPFIAEYANATRDQAMRDDVATQLLRARDTMCDRATGLYYHGRDESGHMAWANPDTGCSPEFWARGIAWLAMALTDSLELLPGSSDADGAMAGTAPALVAMLRDLAGALIRCQQPSGLWCQLPTKPELAGNYAEASASCMIAYALLKGCRMGWLPRDACLQAGRKALAGIKERFVTADERGDIHLSGICKVAGLGGTPYRDGSAAYYLGEPIVSDDFKGFGPFLLALGESIKTAAPSGP